MIGPRRGLLRLIRCTVRRGLRPSVNTRALATHRALTPRRSLHTDCERATGVRMGIRNAGRPTPWNARLLCTRTNGTCNVRTLMKRHDATYRASQSRQAAPALSLVPSRCPGWLAPMLVPKLGRPAETLTQKAYKIVQAAGGLVDACASTHRGASSRKTSRSDMSVSSSSPLIRMSACINS